MPTCSRYSQVIRVAEMYTRHYTIMQIYTEDSGLLGHGTVSWGGGGWETDPRHNVTSQQLCEVNKAAVETENVTEILFKFNWKSLQNAQNKFYLKTLRKRAEIWPLLRSYIRRITIITNQCWHPQVIISLSNSGHVLIYLLSHVSFSSLCSHTCVSASSISFVSTVVISAHSKTATGTSKFVVTILEDAPIEGAKQKKFGQKTTFYHKK